MIIIPGIWGIISKKNIDLSNEFYKEEGTSYLIDHVFYQNASLGRYVIDKFQNDKVFANVDQKTIVTDGITLNFKNLLSKYKTKNYADLIIKLYEKYDWKFVNKLRGNFSIFIYFDKENKLIVSTDHLASKPIYYFFDKESNTFIFSSNLRVVTRGMKHLGFTIDLDITGVYYLLTFGYMLEDVTLIKNVKKLLPGHVIIYEDEKIEIKKYYKLSNKPYIEGNEDDIIKELDKRFSNAIRLEYEKDLEYGYLHIATLSGGLDSRTNIAYAKKLGFNNLTCFTFSESNYLDEKIAKKICSDNNIEFIFYALDNGNYLTKYIDNIILSNDGLILFDGSSHLYNCLKKISFQNYGLIHTGMIGDLIVGSYLKGKEHYKINKELFKRITHSNILFHKLHLDINNFDYESGELFAFYTKCVNAVFNGYRMIEQFTEFSSPFLYIDFLEYALRIHPKYRYEESIYFKWINKCISEFSKYRWEKCGLRPIYPISIMKYSRMFRRLIGKTTFGEKYVSMNPMKYWWKKNTDLQKKINSIFNENIKNLKNYPDILKDVEYLFNKKDLLTNKTQAITIIKSVNILGLNENKKT